MRSFADASLVSVLPERYAIDGAYHIRVPVIGQLSYLQGFDVQIIEGMLNKLLFCEVNGFPVVNLSARALDIIGNKIHFEQHSDGRGCLPNMSASAPYTLQLYGKGTIKITYHGRQIPSPVNLAGEPQEQMPPYMGLINCFNELYKYPFLGRLGDRVQPIYRVGNWVKRLWVIFVDGEENPLEVEHDVLQWDDRLVTPGELTYYPEGRAPKTTYVNYTKLDTGIYRWDFPEGLPTWQATYLAPRWYSKRDGQVSFIVQDEMRPAPVLAR